jgi:iron complex transport system ATP-binding protein
VVVVAHDIGSVSRWVDRVALLADGRMVADGNPADVLEEKTLESAYGIGVKVVADGDDRAVFPMVDSKRGDGI